VGSPFVPGVHIKFVKINNDATTCSDVLSDSVVVTEGEMSKSSVLVQICQNC